MPVQVKEQWDVSTVEADMEILDRTCEELEKAGKFDGVITMDPTSGYPTRIFADQESADAYVVVLKALSAPPTSVEVTTI